MNILIVDGQGGGVGRQLVQAVKNSLPDSFVMAVGTNSAAASNMLKAGADAAATGENAVIVAARKADVIAGPIGIVVADSLYGEITPAMALAVAQSNAKRVLLPFQHCDNVIVGVGDFNISHLIQMAADEIKSLK
ncbi:MAG: DUF3842 family protein [Lentisphaeria bacterium]|nr:DUF3842 family protein [Lentisphaerota bacterium]MBO5644117.1 DUF3842 family protein [Lentisphaeria bacterium]MBO5990623.1 DUF3842 family protein [Lentisphaeria bacterium]MBO7153740.1 DUF3842 family protein [Lentisphaeria bacterium]MBR2633607.1 DUF3842 family protein [Lentisphaeria bacterium]